MGTVSDFPKKGTEPAVSSFAEEAADLAGKIGQVCDGNDVGTVASAVIAILIETAKRFKLHGDDEAVHSIQKALRLVLLHLETGAPIEVLAKALGSTVIQQKAKNDDAN